MTILEKGDTVFGDYHITFVVSEGVPAVPQGLDNDPGNDALGEMGPAIRDSSETAVV